MCKECPGYYHSPLRYIAVDIANSCRSVKITRWLFMLFLHAAGPPLILMITANCSKFWRFFFRGYTCTCTERSSFYPIFLVDLPCITISMETSFMETQRCRKLFINARFCMKLCSPFLLFSVVIFKKLYRVCDVYSKILLKFRI